MITLNKKKYKYFVSYVVKSIEDNKIITSYENTDVNTNRKIKSLQDIMYIEKCICDPISNYKSVTILNYNLLNTSKDYYIGEIGTL